jgi:hypothetical protein
MEKVGVGYLYRGGKNERGKRVNGKVPTTWPTELAI